MATHTQEAPKTAKFSKQELKLWEAVRLALSRLHSAEVGGLINNLGSYLLIVEELKRASAALVNGADRCAPKTLEGDSMLDVAQQLRARRT